VAPGHDEGSVAGLVHDARSATPASAAAVASPARREWAE